MPYWTTAVVREPVLVLPVMTSELHFGSPILAAVHAFATNKKEVSSSSSNKGATKAGDKAGGDTTSEVVILAGGGGRHSGVDNGVVRLWHWLPFARTPSS